MKIIKKDMFRIGTLVVLFAIGGFINDFFVEGTSAYSKICFQIMTSFVLVLGFLSYPWKKSPWTNFAGLHTLSCLLVWIGGVAYVHWQAAPILHMYYFFSGTVFVSSGIYFLVQNYRGKYSDLFETNN